MPEDVVSRYSCLILALAALAVNVPLGYIRESCPKFSFKWLFWIHASIPLIIYLRVAFGLSKLFIPVGIFFAVAGQIWGSRWRRRHMSPEDRERLQQIPPLDVNTSLNVTDSDVTVILLNMGGPRTSADVRDFQKRLFSDPLLIRFPLSWAFQGLFAWLLAGIRSTKTAQRYRRIGGGSPIYESTRRQMEALQEELNKRGRRIHVTFSFNYSPPLPVEVINSVKEAGRKYALPLSLSPHYSKATTGSSIHYLTKAAETVYPALRFLDAPQYYLHDGYVRALAERIKEQVRAGESLDDFYLLFSAHSLPLYFLTEGDPYPFQVAQTAAKILGLLERKDRWALAYQSAVGPLQWIKPSTEDMIAALARRGVEKLIVIPVSFVADHIETLCEIDMECRQFAERIGIHDFRMSKAIECHPGFIGALADSVEDAFKNGHCREDVRERPYCRLITSL